MTVATLARLRSLRQQAGATPPSAPLAAPLPSSTTQGRGFDLEQLRRLARLGPRALPARATGCDALPGIALAEGVRLIERCYPAFASGALDFGPRLPGRFNCNELLCIDTETTGLAGGTGTRAFVIGAAHWRNDALCVRQLLLTRLSGEPALLAEFARWLQSWPVLVSYNGKSYDLPLLRTRWRLARQHDASAGLSHLDLLHEVRRRYRGVWENCRLATVERQLLQVVRDDDLPGSEAPAAFTRWLRQGDAHDLLRVLQHNAQDLVSLAQLALRLGNDDAGSAGTPPRAPSAAEFSLAGD